MNDSSSGDSGGKKPDASGEASEPALPEDFGVWLRIISEWRDSMDATTPEQVALLEEDLDDLEAADRGAGTVASEVVVETSRALVRAQVLGHVKTHSTTLRYAPFRLRYVFDTLLSLHTATYDLTARSSTWGLAQAHLGFQMKKARDARNSVLQGLARASRRRPDLIKEISKARGIPGRPVQMAAGLLSLASLLDRWADDTHLRLRLESVGLLSTAPSLRTTRNDLLSAHDAVERIPMSIRDTPDINVLEGRLLTEFRELYRAFEDNQTQIPGLPRLPLGPVLRRVMGRPTPDPVLDEPALDPIPDLPLDPKADPEPDPTA